MHDFCTCQKKRYRAQATSDQKTCLATIFVGSRQCAAEFFLQVPKFCIDLDLTLPYILIIKTYGRFARENKLLALGGCVSQTCSSAGRMFAASRSCLDYYRRIIPFPQHPLRIRVRPRNIQPHIKTEIEPESHSDPNSKCKT